ncbi:MAG: phenylalanine--tRNA ligase subunit beta [Bacilli bacterium]|nr:phenylalanine--tRNA ligase subunit beta [Bacilli bacterium]
MKVSLNWLKKLVNIDGLTPEEIAHRLTFAGVEVESIDKASTATNLVIGQVVECENMPDSDHLHLCKVNVGEAEPLNIVCGAPNVRVGLKVIVALDGAKLPGGTIKKGKIRGYESNGMLCSLVELGVDQKYLREEQIKGIEEVKEDAVVGDKNVLGLFGLDDVILDLKLLANRSDCNAMINVAREIQTLFERETNIPEPKVHALVKNDIVVGSETERCSQFSARIVRGIETKPSPDWMRETLQAEGIRSINNVVDIGNYIMLLTGQPLHMYDLDKLPKLELIARDDLDNDFVALDEKTYKLQNGDIAITSGGKAMCLGGVMGSLECAVDENTKNIVIEAANFDFASVRRTSIRLNLASDSSARFVKGINPNQYEYVMGLTTDLLVELCNAKEVSETKTYLAKEIEQKVLECEISYINNRLGTEFSDEEVVNALRRAQLDVTQAGTKLVVKVPFQRIDIGDKADLSEEVIRILGFENVKSELPLVRVSVGALDELVAKKRVVRDFLRGNGLDEQLTYSLIRKSEIADFRILNKLEPYLVMHPLTDEHEYVRTNLLPSLMNVLEYNLNHGNTDLSFFEVSDLFGIGEKTIHLAAILNGKNNRQGRLVSEGYNYYHMKGLAEGILRAFALEPNRYSFVKNDEAEFHPGKSAKIVLQGKTLAVLGELHPSVLAKYGLKTSPIVMEMDLSVLFAAQSGLKKMASISKFPTVSRDIAIIVNEKLTSEEIIKEIRAVNRSMIKDVEVFDVYKGEHVEAGKVSLAISITYGDNEKTLTADEINAVETKVLAVLEKKFAASLRK